MKRIAAASPLLKARIAGVFYLFTILTGIASLYISGTLGFAVMLFAGVCYMAVTLLFYDLFKPVSRSLSLVAAAFSVAGFVVGALSWQPQGVNVGLGCFGVYCLLIGYLIFRSTFLPRVLGALMAVAGLAYLTFLSPSLAAQLAPFHIAAGVVGESSLTLWLLVMGVDVQRWKDAASASAPIERAPKGVDKFEGGTVGK